MTGPSKRPHHPDCRWGDHPDDTNCYDCPSASTCPDANVLPRPPMSPTHQHPEPSTVDAGGLSEEESLARIIATTFTENRDDSPFIRSRKIADAVLAAGYLSPEDAADREERALREAADALDAESERVGGMYSGDCTDWLRARASSAPKEERDV